MGFDLAHQPRLRRAKEPAPGAIPVTVVTGPLGSGKTTLLQSVLETAEGARSALVVNEFAELGIDQHLLAADTIALLANGCFCCRPAGDLAGTLRSLLEQRRVGRVPDFERVLIETSGVADPSAILLSIASDPEVARDFFVQRIVGLVDATMSLWDTLASEHHRRQLALADLILVTKVDRAGPDVTDALRMELAEMCPGVPVDHCSRGQVGISQILARPALVMPIPLTLRQRPHRSDITKHIIVRREPWDWDAFSTAMQALAALRAPDLLRVKGLLHLHDRERPIVYHRVQHLVDRITELDRWPGERETQLVFITRNIAGGDIDRLIEVMHACAPCRGSPAEVI
ncbi:CobW family GTP-binding protein [Microvirga massiliensis]|uniref:CobW family GTP-binding protein n=1 Tax=Microvirga massiliensis TaxID=1033741 RepID=UPI0006600FAD|nr:GTP-binding protein [Microvirga massiliensis]